MNYYLKTEMPTYYLDPPVSFYRDLKSYTDELIDHFTRTGYAALKETLDYLVEHDRDYCREEHIVHLLMAGVFWRSYHGYLHNVNHLTGYLSRILLTVRSFTPLKRGIDVIRGRINKQLYLNPDTVPVLKKPFDRLLLWLKTSGEFREETKRLVYVKEWLSGRPLSVQTCFFRELSHLTGNFIKTAHSVLGAYTENVESFLTVNYGRYRGREDFIYAMRDRSHYYLNMVGAEVMNRSLWKQFRSKPRKVALLAACMRGRNRHTCKAQMTATGKRCVLCSPDCNLGKAAKSVARLGVDTYLVPHSSNFTKTLKKWKHEGDTALVAAACVLNLLTGGYEMKNQSIAAQCVFLNYSGCSGHWCDDDLATAVDINRLVDLAGG